VGLAGKETGSGLSNNLYTLTECWGLVSIMCGLNTVARCSEKTLGFSTSSVILELSGRRSGGVGLMCLRIFFVAFQSEPFVGFRFEM